MIRRRYLRNRARGNIIYPGLIAAWSAKGKTNDDKDRAILKDLTGNRHDITLNGFSFSEMSGYGRYKTNMLNWKYNKNSAVILSSQNKFIIYNTLEIATHFWDYVSELPLGTIHRPSFKLKISGLNEDEAIYYTYRDGEDFSVLHEGNLYNGINIFPEINAEIVTEKLPYTMVFEIQNARILDKEITFEILPEYPDALVFDGINDYGVNHNVPSLSDYTIIVKKKALNNNGIVCATIGNFGEVAFVIDDRFKRVGMVFANSFSSESLVKWVDNISYQTKNSYNGKTISVGKIITTHGFSISMYGGRYWKGAFYSAYLFNRSLDEQEIKAFIRKYIDPEYLLPSEIPTPDCYYDFSQGSNNDENRETIKDYSGNGNDAVAHNFAWNEKGSGYKDSALCFDGVDDYVSLDAFDSGFKTVFMVCIPLALNGVFYDQRKEPNNMYAFGSSDGQTKEIAYNRANNTKQYINGILNTTIGIKDLLNKKQLIHNIEVLANEENSQSPKLAGSLLSSIPAKICIYKFLGFKEVLTEEQIQVVIKKYNLLDGVDEIEVS